MSKYFFSIIIPTYNREFQLERCLESLKNQTFKDFEVIVCDDGSWDSTNFVIDNYIGCLNLIYSYADNWGGPAVPRNRGISLSNGDWLCFLDSDDWFFPNKLSVLREYILSESADFYYHSLENVSDDVTRKLPTLKTWKINSEKADIQLLTSFNAILTSSTCIRANKLKENNLFFEEDRSIAGIEDFDLWIRIAKTKQFQFYFINKKLGYYWSGDGDHLGLKGSDQVFKVEKVYYNNLIGYNSEFIKTSLAAMSYQKSVLLINDRYFSNNNLIRKLLFESIRNGILIVKVKAFFRLLILM
jgi:glycosyltransferase involved in cell wall biosynthesis